MKQKYFIGAIVVLLVLLVVCVVYKPWGSGGLAVPPVSTTSENTPTAPANNTVVPSDSAQTAPAAINTSLYLSLLKQVITRDDPKAAATTDWNMYRIMNMITSPAGDKFAFVVATQDISTPAKTLVTNGIFFLLKGDVGNDYIITKGAPIPAITNIHWTNDSTVQYTIGDQVKVISAQ